MRQASRSFLKKVFDGDASRMLVHFVEHEKMTAEQIKELRALLDSKRKKPGSDVMPLPFLESASAPSSMPRGRRRFWSWWSSLRAASSRECRPAPDRHSG